MSEMRLGVVATVTPPAEGMPKMQLPLLGQASGAPMAGITTSKTALCSSAFISVDWLRWC